MTASLHPVRGEPLDVLALLRDWVEGDGSPLVMRTSGSTGEPKDVVLSREAMVASATASLRRLGGPGGWLLPLPVTGVGGLQVLLRSILAGTTPTVDSRLDAGLVEAERRYVSIVPTQLHRLEQAGRLGDLAGFDAVLVGGAATDPQLLRRATDAGVTIVRTYGMTETCGGCVYDGVPLDDVRMRIADDGQVELAGPVLFDGYSDPVATAAVLRDGWFRTGDLGEIADGVLSVIGRVDDVVQSGGVKVPLPAVTAALKQLPGVHDAVALGRPDPEWGTQVVAFVVTERDLSHVRDELEAAGLDRRWAPREVVTLGRLPLLANGKVDRRHLLDRLS